MKLIVASLGVMLLATSVFPKNTPFTLKHTEAAKLSQLEQLKQDADYLPSEYQSQIENIHFDNWKPGCSNRQAIKGVALNYSHALADLVYFRDNLRMNPQPSLSEVAQVSYELTMGDQIMHMLAATLTCTGQDNLWPIFNKLADRMLQASINAHAVEMELIEQYEMTIRQNQALVDEIRQQIKKKAIQP